jgi:hypothetical protein
VTTVRWSGERRWEWQCALRENEIDSRDGNRRFMCVSGTATSERKGREATKEASSLVQAAWTVLMRHVDLHLCCYCGVEDKDEGENIEGEWWCRICIEAGYPDTEERDPNG